MANWLKSIGRTEEELREMFREQADLSVRRALVLGELIEAEKIEVTDEQIDEEIDSLVAQMVGSAAGNQEAIRNLFDTPDGRNSIRSQLLTRFAIERLESICAQPEGEDAGSTPRTSRRRRSGAAADVETPETSADAEDAASTDDAAEASEDEA
jgi:FKBP-type peptidyl-prolyl cis-trans isomerase (trigger factor)